MMKFKTLTAPTPIRDTRPVNGYSTCLPPVRRVPVLAPCGHCRTPTPAKVLTDGECNTCFHARMRAEAAEVAREAALREQAEALDNLSDAELRALEPIADALKAHDWTYDYSDDISVWRNGKAERTRIDALLASIPTAQARALWAMYAPAALGAWRLS